MTMNELIMKAREKKCSDIHISEGMPVSFRIHGQLLDSGFSFPAAETREMILSMLSDEQREQLENGDDVDFAIETPDYCRQRVNVFRQMKKVAATIRLLNNTIPTLEQLQMPKVLRDLADCGPVAAGTARKAPPCPWQEVLFSLLRNKKARSKRDRASCKAFHDSASVMAKPRHGARCI